jgi:hypothetical protein
MRLSKLWALALLVALPAWADDANFRPYLLGGRAAGMGGAFTALSDDGSGSYYNPGGLAFARHSSVSLSASVYGLISGSYHDALGPGHDYTYKDLNVFPVSTSAVRKVGEIDPVTGVGKDTLVFSVFVPDAIHNDDRDTLNANQNTFFLTQDSQTLWIGGGYARRFGRVGVGAMGYFLLGTQLQQLDLSAIGAPATQTGPATSGNNFALVTARIDTTTEEFLGALGVRFDATDNLRLGLSVYSPAVGTGSRREFVRIAGADATNPGAMLVVNRDDLSATPTLPVRVQLGGAWEEGPWTFAADVIYLGAREAHFDENLASQGLDALVERTQVFNVSVGGEYVLDDKYPLRAGFFTDLAGTHSPDELVGQRIPTNSIHLNRYGMSFSGGLRSEHVRTDVGINVLYGSGEDIVPGNFDFSNLEFANIHEFNAYVFLATSYEF